MSSYFVKNLKAFQTTYPLIANELQEKNNYEKYEVSFSRSGVPSVKVMSDDGNRKVPICLHSQYDPVREAELFAENQLKKENHQNYLVYGFGFGYHVESMLNRLNLDQTLTVCELHVDLFILAMQHRDLTSIIYDPRVKLVISSNESFLIKKFIESIQDKAHLILHLASVKSIPSNYQKLKFILEDWNVKIKVGHEWKERLNENMNSNSVLKDPNVSIYFNRFTNRPFIIVSAGPSLNKNINLLHEVKERAFIFAVGTSLKPLLQRGIKPDMFCIIDPDPITYKQIEGLEDLDVPFVYLISASSYTVSKYNGPRYVAYNEVMDHERTEGLIHIGGSVATAVLDLSIKFGGNPIIFVGQDLAYSENLTHVSGGMYGDNPDVKSLPNMRKVKGQNGEWLNTSLGLLSYKYWIENKIQDHPDIRFINATEGGAFIDGCEHMSLRNVIDSVLCEM